MASDESGPNEAVCNASVLPVELVLRDHYGRESRLTLGKLPAVVGRDENADVPLADPWVSHRHCEIDQLGSVLVVRDLGSKNAMFLHHHRISESQVLSGERLTVGQTEIVMRYGGDVRTSTAPQVNETPRKATEAKPAETVELLY